jgi:hypothetical protein
VCRSLGARTPLASNTLANARPVKVERIRNGTAAVRTAECYPNSIAKGRDFLACATEVLLSQCCHEIACEFSGIGGLANVAPTRLELDRDGADTDCVASCHAGLSDLGLVASKDKLADCFTKVIDPMQLRNAVGSFSLLHAINKWIAPFALSTDKT